MRRTPRLVSLVLLMVAVSLSACDRGVPIARKPLETKSRFCDADRSLYRAGGVLFCADPGLRFASRITYTVEGNAAAEFDRQVQDVIDVAGCLTGRAFDRVANGAFKMTIDNKIDPPTQTGASHHGAATTYLNAHFGAARTGFSTVATTNGTSDVVGSGLEDGLWHFLGLEEPRPTAFEERAFAGLDAGAAPREAADSARYCAKDHVLFETDGVFFCAPRAHAWPAMLGYAFVGDTDASASRIAATAAFVSRLTRIGVEPATKKPAVLIALTEKTLTGPAVDALLRASGVEPSDSTLEFLAEEKSDNAEKMAASMVGKRLGPILAEWMTTASYVTDYGSRPGRTAIVGLHNRSLESTEREIEEAFFDPLQIKRPAYHPPQACDGGR